MFYFYDEKLNSQAEHEICVYFGTWENTVFGFDYKFDTKLRGIRRKNNTKNW